MSSERKEAKNQFLKLFEQHKVLRSNEPGNDAKQNMRTALAKQFGDRHGSHFLRRGDPGFTELQTTNESVGSTETSAPSLDSDKYSPK